MINRLRQRLFSAMAVAAALLGGTLGSASAATPISGQVQAGGSAVANASVTLWAATEGDPRQLAQAKSGADGRFDIDVYQPPDGAISLYLIARGGTSAVGAAGGVNPAIALLSVLGSQPPATVTINEMTTIASVWTNAQFIDAAGIKGNGLGLRIAAGNVPNFVDLASGRYGVMIQDALNSTQTPTMANFATLSNALAGCATRIKADACDQLFAAATGRDGKVPTDTLTAAISIAHNMAYKPERIFALLDAFYPVQGRGLRNTPFLPYLNVAPSAWVLPLHFTGGGYTGGAKVMFDSEGNAWSGANFIVGSQGRDALWDGNLSEFAPNGKPLSPMTTGFTGGGLQGPGFGTAIDANDHVWINSTSGKTISLFDKTGKPLSPPEGYNFGGKLGFMQGIIVTPAGDVWTVDFTNDRVIFMPKGDPAQAKFYCEAPPGTAAKDGPCKLSAPFHLIIDQQDHIWVDNAIGDKVARFPASDPSKVEVFSTGGHSGKGMAVDSKGNVWIANTLGAGLSLETDVRLLIAKETGGALTTMDQIALHDLLSTPGLGNVSALRPDGTPLPGSPFNPSGSIWGAWAVSIDGNDHVWISNFAPGGGLTELCGARTETCPAGMKTGDAISPPGGYRGGGMQMLVDVSIDPAGNAWASDNWQDPMACYGKTAEGASTRCGGQGMTVFYGMARPVRAPQIGPAQPAP